MKPAVIRAALFCVALAFLPAFTAPARAQAQSDSASPDSAFSIPKAQLIQPGELNHILQAKDASRPLVIQVGSRIMFAQAHIPGATYAGPATQPAGRAQLQTLVASLPRTAFIVLYCGCCPWERCPNMGPAFHQLHDMGFTNVKALYIASNFGTDWVDKGFPVDRGQ